MVSGAWPLTPALGSGRRAQVERMAQARRARAGTRQPAGAEWVVVGWYTFVPVVDRLDPDLLSGDEVFEIDAQATHLFKHPYLGIDDVYEVWASDPLFYPAKPPAHWLMCAEVAGRVLMVPLAPSRDGDPRRCRLIGCYEASAELAAHYRRNR